MVNNAGIALGPAVGGFVASRSYTYAFLGAAAGMITYSLLLALRARETLNKADLIHTNKEIDNLGGYDKVFKDHPYIIFTLLIALGLIAPSMLWTLLAIYTKQNFGLPENLFGWLPTTNALICVFAQLFVTQISRRFRALPVAPVGMALYAFGVGSVALMGNFWGFWASMVMMTFGELTLIPTVSKYIADHAPTNMRGRYMSVYWFAWAAARGAAPMIGGFLNYSINPRSIWIGGLIIGLISASGLLIFSRQKDTRMPAKYPPPRFLFEGWLLSF